jgi:hypothetical protein
MRAIIALAMILTAGVANAQPPKAAMGLSAMGFGTSTCAMFNNSYRGLEETYFVWAQGFMSGMNFALSIDPTGGRYADLSAKSISEQKTYIRLYCHNHPSDAYLQAVLNLYSELPFAPAPH